MTSFTLGQMQTARDLQDKFEELPVKERALRQFVLRLSGEDWTYKVVPVGKVQRRPIVDRVLNGGGAIISVVDGDETFSAKNTNTAENNLTITVAFLLPVATDEEPSTLLNLFAADVLQLLSGQFNLTEEGSGQNLSVNVQPTAFSPYYDEVGQTKTVYGEFQFLLIYRHQQRRPYSPAGN